MTHKQVIVIRRDLKMRRGKEIAQGAHASLAAILNMSTIDDSTLTLELGPNIRPWICGPFKKICVTVDSEEELLAVYESALKAGIATALIRDNGLTEFHGVPTLTTCAIGPDFDERINPITGELKLY